MVISHKLPCFERGIGRPLPPQEGSQRGSTSASTALNGRFIPCILMLPYEHSGCATLVGPWDLFSGCNLVFCERQPTLIP